VDVGMWDERISALGKRHFVLKSARSPDPTLFTSRWAMSYLRGPLTRSEIVRLSDARPSLEAATSRSMRSATPQVRDSADAAPVLADDESPIPPKVSRGIAVGHLDAGVPWRREVGVAAEGSRLAAGVAVRIHMLFDETRADLKHDEEWEAVAFPLTEHLTPSDFLRIDHDPRDFRDEGPDNARYVLPDAPIGQSKWFTQLKKELEDWLYRNRSMQVLRNTQLKLYSRVGESEDDFVERCLKRAEDHADKEAEKLRDKIERRLNTARRRTAEAERRVRELDSEVDQRKQHEMIAGAGDVLSMFLGGRRRVRSLSGAAGRRGVTRRSQERLLSAKEKLKDQLETIEELEEELTEDIADIWDRWRDIAEDFETFDVGLEKTDIRVEDVRLFWAPEGS